MKEPWAKLRANGIKDPYVLDTNIFKKDKCPEYPRNGCELTRKRQKNKEYEQAMYKIENPHARKYIEMFN